MQLLTCLLVAITLIGGNYRQEFKGVTYTKPTGWEEATEGEAKVFAPKDLGKGEILAIIMTGALPSSASNREEEFSATTAIANDKGKTSEVSKVTKQEGPVKTVLVQTLKLDLAPLGKHDRLYAEVCQGNRRVFITVIMNRESFVEKYGAALSDFLTSVGFSSAPAPVPAAGKIPVGNTPNLFVGNEGWLPSGRGIPIPSAAIVDGKPRGLWWRLDQTSEGLKPLLQLFMPNGIQTKFPRMGGGMLFDYEGQKAQSGTNALGTFDVVKGTFVESLNGFEQKRAFSFGRDPDGLFFRTGGFQFRPLVALTNKSISGVWVSKSSEYEFHEDGSFEAGTIRSSQQWSAGSMYKGRYILDGFLIMITPSNGSGATVERIGLAGNMIAKSGTFYVRK